MSFENADIGLIGLGVMGRNFAINVAEKGFKVTGYDRDEHKVQALEDRGRESCLQGVKSMETLLPTLRKPRAVMMLVPAGQAVESVIEDLSNRLEKGDIIVDGGNSHFTDTDRHAETLAGKGINFLGVGVSGGAAGARNGPSMMPGGPKEAYERVRRIFEAAAAKVDGEPCVTYLGAGSAGHYVKMVHNGIEYALMQLIAESYDMLRRVGDLSNDEIAETFARWNDGPLNSFLVEITSHVLRVRDGNSDRRLVDVILDSARQKGTGKWTSQDAMELQIPVPTIDAAVSMRDLSAFKEERQSASEALPLPNRASTPDPRQLKDRLEKALHVGMIAGYAQGMSLLREASHRYSYNLNLADVARIWRNGCIIRAALVDDIRQVLRDRTDTGNLILVRPLAKIVADNRDALYRVLCTGFENGIPLPALASTLSYCDAFRTARLPANLIQAQRDYFGSHGFERLDHAGSFHSDWTPSGETA